MEFVTLLIAFVFLLAGVVKGAVGLGLPPIAMGLLVIVMPPVEAAALVVLPSFLTNTWQMFDGPHLKQLLRRYWLLLVCAFAGTLVGSDWLASENTGLGTAILGAILAAYALAGLVAVRYTVTVVSQKWLDPVIGLLTGLATAATGVSSIPVVPYLQAAGLEKNELIQAMGLSFTIATVALAYNLLSVGALSPDLGPAAGVATVSVFVGLWLGRVIRKGLKPETFRFWFLIALLALGIYLVIGSVI